MGLSDAGLALFLLAALAFFVGLGLLLVKSRRRFGKWMAGTAPVFAVIGFIMVGIGESPNQEAKQAGYLSAADRTAAQAEGITDPDRWREVKLARATDAERAVLEAEVNKANARVAEAKAKADEADRIREATIRANIEDAKRTAAAVEAANRANLAEAQRCRQDIQCIGDQKHIEATFACKRYVEAMAKTDFQWIDTWSESKFSRFRFRGLKGDTVTYVGDKIQYQNGLGNWVRHTYECDYNIDDKSVIDVRARPGRLPG